MDSVTKRLLGLVHGHPEVWRWLARRRVGSMGGTLAYGRPAIRVAGLL
jgi:hypothetical protein